MSKIKETKIKNEIYIGKKKYTRGMKKPSQLPNYDFPSDFFAVEVSKITEKVESK